MANSHKNVAAADAHAPALHASTHNVGSTDPMTNAYVTTLDLGHVSDTTLARVSAGVVSIEGTNIVKAGAATSSGITMATARLLGRTTASTGAIEEITVGSGLSLSAGSLTATGGSGNVATDTIWDAAGDLVQGTGADTAAKLTIGASGKILGSTGSAAAWVLAPTRHSCIIYHNTTQTVNSAVILANSEVIDTDAYHDTSSNTSRITIPSGLAGLYLLEYGTNITSLAVGEFCRIRINGGSNISTNMGDTTSGYVSGLCVYPLAVADYVEVFFTGNRTVGHASAYEAQFHFSATLISL